MELDALQEDGFSLRVHLQNLERQTRKPLRQLEPLPLPYEISHVWGWWKELHGHRQVAFDINPFSFSEIKDWFWLMHLRPQPIEIEALLVIERIFMDWYRSRPKPKPSQ